MIDEGVRLGNLTLVRNFTANDRFFLEDMSIIHNEATRER